MSTKIIVTLCVIVVLIFVGGVYFLSGNNSIFNSTNDNAQSVFKANKVENFGKQSNTQAKPGYKKYTHPNLNFSFEYPDEYIVGSFEENDGEIILVQDKDKNGGVQLFVTNYDESSTDLTLERIKQDNPDMVITAQKYVDLGATKAIYFQSTTGDKATHEFWFIYQNKLFQLTASIENGGLMESIISSLSSN
ncbi:hypothetical protein KW795_02970 [Candidatus Microgenomates bacterium]|nr:hypothetical protein [Candidatus Microgenomates bacterium]